MKRFLLTIFAVVITVVTLAAGAKLWVYRHSGNHLSMDIAEFDSISFIEPGFLEIYPQEKQIGSNGGRFTVEIHTNKAWTATVNDPAIILGVNHGTGNANISVTAMPNADDEPYNAIVTVTLEDGIYENLFITVGDISHKISNLKFKENSYVIEEGNDGLNMRKQLECTPAGVLDTCRISWHLSNTSLAYMDGSYLVPIRAGELDVTATIQGISVNCTVTIVGNTPIPPQPSVPTVSGTDGKYTIVFHAPEIDCSYPTIYFFGDFQYNDPSDVNAPKAERIVQNGFSNWFKIVFDSDSEYTAKGKICPNSIDGSMGWNNQGTLSLISGNATILNDVGVSNKIKCNEVGSVVYVEVTKWAGDICAVANPSGTAVFNVILKDDFPSDFDVEELEVSVAFWTMGTVEMTRDFSYSGEGYRFTGVYEDYPANQQYKYNARYKGGSWVWEEHSNRTMPYSLTTNDVVTEWEEIPWAEIPGGVGTFTISFGSECKADTYDEIIFTGNFDEYDWDNSQRIMTNNGNGSFSWTGEYPKNFRYKMIFRKYGEQDLWVGPETYFRFDGKTFNQNWNCY